mgnify:CR=1 FL=1
MWAMQAEFTADSIFVRPIVDSSDIIVVGFEEVDIHFQHMRQMVLTLVFELPVFTVVWE